MRKNFRRTPRTTKIEHKKIFLPQRNRVVYNGLQPAKMKIFYHGIFSHEYFQLLIFPKLRYDPRRGHLASTAKL